MSDSDWSDKPLPEDEAIDAAFPTRSGDHDTYGEAMRLVGAKHSKRALVALVNWLLHERLKAFDYAVNEIIEAVEGAYASATTSDRNIVYRDEIVAHIRTVARSRRALAKRR